MPPALRPCVALRPPAARHTLSLLTLKPGLFTGAGRDAAGTVWWDDLGVPCHSEAASAWLAGPPAAAARAHASHKGSYGDVAVIGGEGLDARGLGMGGAALLAASAALLGGAGRVLVALLGGTLDLDVRQPELMFRHVDALQLEQLTVVCGCGGGEAVRAVLPQVLAQAPRLVLDADALNAIASDAALAQAWQTARQKRMPPCSPPIRWKQRACWAPIPPACSRTASLRPSSWPSGSSAWWCSRARAR
jgi:hypothetical protein